MHQGGGKPWDWHGEKFLALSGCCCPWQGFGFPSVKSWDGRLWMWDVSLLIPVGSWRSQGISEAVEGGPVWKGDADRPPHPAGTSQGLSQHSGPPGTRLQGHSSWSCSTAQVNELHSRFLHQLITSLPPPGGFASGPRYSSWSSLGQHRPRWAI